RLDPAASLDPPSGEHRPESGAEHDGHQHQPGRRRGDAVDLLHVERDEVDPAEQQQAAGQIDTDTATYDRIAKPPQRQHEIYRHSYASNKTGARLPHADNEE